MKKKKKGFTLIELLCVIGIMSIVGATISTVFDSTLKLNTDQRDKLDLQQNVTSIQRAMQTSITKANKVVDPTFDSGLSRYIFVGTNMDQNNAYCRLMGYKPLLYVEGVTGNRAFYVYNGVKGEVRKVAIPPITDTSTTTVIQYYTGALTYDDTTKGTEWSPVAAADMLTYQTMTYDISASSIILAGLTISYDSTNDLVVNPVVFNSFSIIGGFTKLDYSGVVIGRYVVFKSNTLDSDGTYPWFYIPINPETLVYYTHTTDTLLGKYIVKNGSVDGIIVTNNLTDPTTGSLKGHYDIQLDAKKNTILKHSLVRISVVDYGGNVK